MNHSIWKFKELGDMLILCVSSGEPRDEDLDASIEPHQAERVTKAIMLALGHPSINAAQRKRVADGLKKHPNYVATDSRVSRGVITALNWLGNPMKGCSPERIVDAVRDLGVPRGYTEEQVLRELEQLRQEVERELKSQGT